MWQSLERTHTYTHTHACHTQAYTILEKEEQLRADVNIPKSP